MYTYTHILTYPLMTCLRTISSEKGASTATDPATTARTRQGHTGSSLKVTIIIAMMPVINTSN